MIEKPTVKYPIRWILLVTMIGLITVLVVILTSLHIYSQKNSLETELNKRVLLMKNNLSLIGKSLSETIGRQAIINIAEYNFSNLTEQLHEAVLKNTDLTYAILMDRSRIVYIHTEKPSLKKTELVNDHDLFAAKQSKFSTYEFIRNGQKHIEFITPIQFSKEMWGCLRLGFSYVSLDSEIKESQREIKQQTRNVITQSIWTSILFIFACGLVTFYLAETLSKPLVKLTDAAHHLAKGDFTAKKSINLRSQNEVGVLASEFVKMSENLKDYSDNLEQKVKDRTQKLSRTLEDLKAAQTQLVESQKNGFIRWPGSWNSP